MKRPDLTQFGTQNPKTNVKFLNIIFQANNLPKLTVICSTWIAVKNYKYLQRVRGFRFQSKQLLEDIQGHHSPQQQEDHLF